MFIVDLFSGLANVAIRATEFLMLIMLLFRWIREEWKR